MLKVYYIRDYVSIDGSEWRSVGGYGEKVIDGEPENELRLDNASFNEVYEYLTRHLLSGVWNDTTFFRKKPLIQVSYNDAWDWVEYRHFNTMSYKREYKEWKNVPLKWLMEHASADQFIQYLKERGITTCPMNF
jgi:hypothetical protein